MISLMTYAAVIAGLLGLAALFLERILSDLGRPRRGVWLIALAASLAAPAIALILPASTIDANRLSLPIITEIPTIRAELDGAGASGAWDFAWLASDRVNDVLLVFWVASGALALLVCTFAALRLRRLLRNGRKLALDDGTVVVSEALGPAVVGFIKPEIVLPEWIAAADASLRSLVLKHEREHIEARDQLALLLALAVLASMPWNPALWWQLKRLRAAIEMDCDARVLKAGVDQIRYSEALLAVRERSHFAPFGAVALTEPASLLERRIRIMLEQARQFSFSRTGVRLAAALGTLIFAFAVEAPLAQQGNSSDGPRPVAAIRTTVFDKLQAAQLCMANEDYACARAWLADTAQMDLSGYETAQYWNFVAYLEYQTDNLDGAIAAYQNVVAQEGVPPELRRQALRFLSGIYASESQYQEAYEAINQVLALDGVDTAAMPSLSPSEGEYLPIVKVAPTYPAEASQQGLEGEVVLRYTVTKTGSTADIEIVESSSELFEQSALESAAKYKYKPRVIDGEPVDVPGVMTKIAFVLAR